MELRIFNRELEPLGIVDEVTSVIYAPTYWSAGTFGDIKLQAPVTENNTELLAVGNLIVVHDDDPEYTDDRGTWRRACQITYINISVDETGTETIEAQGCLLKKWLAKRALIAEQTLTGTGQEIINTLIRDNVGSGAAELRQFPAFEILDQEEIEGETIDYAAVFGYGLDEAVYDRSLASKLGHDILVNEKNRLFGFWLYKGADLSSTNNDGNRPCIFSRDFDNINGQEYTQSIEDIKNVAYVQSAEDDDGNTYAIEVGELTAEGLDREELFVDASEISWTTTDSSGESATVPYDTYMQLMATLGETQLASCVEALNFESDIADGRGLSYRTDFDVGDIVTCIDKSWGIKIDARITQMKESWQNGVKTLTATFGTSQPTLFEKIKKVR